MTAVELAQAVGDETACICFFGGDPTSQVSHALQAARLAVKRKHGDILRICWETNGSAREPYLTEMADTSLQSGGCIKYDLKAWNDNLHHALCGVSNRQTLANFAKLAARVVERPDPPFLVASTLLVPGYIDQQEVSDIARFIAGLSPDIPYRLLAFHPQFYLSDLPFTSLDHATRCLQAAKQAGLTRVSLGNKMLLGNAY